MSLPETILFSLAKRLYQSELGHSSEMKDALQSENAYADFRSQQSQFVLNAAAACGIRLKGKVVVDFGCFDGAITSRYADAEATHVYGIDIDKDAIAKARQHHSRDHITFLESDVKRMPLQDSSVDVILCYDVFEHVAHPADMLHECYRILRPGGQLLIGTWGWYHPFAPHLWSTMPVPWAHVFSQNGHCCARATVSTIRRGISRTCMIWIVTAIESRRNSRKKVSRLITSTNILSGTSKESFANRNLTAHYGCSHLVQGTHRGQNHCCDFRISASSSQRICGPL